MRTIWCLSLIAIGCDGNGESGLRPDPGGGPRPDARTPGGDATASDGGRPADGGAGGDGGTLAACASVLAPPMNPATPPRPAALPWHRCGGYGSGAVTSVEVAADQGRAVLVTESGDAFVVALPSMTRVATFTHAAGLVSFAALSPQGDLLATVDDPRGEVTVWQVDTGALLHRFFRPPAWPSSPRLGEAAFAPDGRRLAVISVDRIDVWDLPSGAPLPISARPELGGGMRVAFAQGSERLVLGRFMYFGNGPFAGWGQVDIVDAADGANPVRLDYFFYISLPYLAVSGDGRVVAIASDASGDGDNAQFDTADGAPLPVAPITGLPLALATDAGTIAVREPNAITLRRASDGLLLASVPATGMGPSTAHLDLGLALPGTLEGISAVGFADGTPTGAACTVGALLPHDSLTGVARSTDDQTLVTTSSAGVAQAWDVTTGAPATGAPPANLIEPDPISPDGSLRAVPDDGTFHLERLATGEVVQTFGPHPTRVTGLDWGDPTHIVSSAEREPVDRQMFEPSVKVWNATRGALQQSIPGADFGPALFDSMGKRLFVTGRSAVILWCR